MFTYVLLIILALSFILAINSLRKLGHKKEIEEVRESLKKGKVIFQRENSSEGI